MTEEKGNEKYDEAESDALVVGDIKKVRTSPAQLRTSDKSLYLQILEPISDTVNDK